MIDYTFWRLPFLLHITIESAAVFLFTCRPESQLSTKECSVEARLVLRQYGALLASSNLICLGTILQPYSSSLTRQIALALVVYHVFPCHRAWFRLQAGHEGKKGAGERRVPFLARPDLHLVLHVACCAAFAAVGIF
ncbi:uncharacterized protein B0I36DRAFT_311664 [Microdochium trichocladiopsis]|uniref:Uncharacterized protein n=1 Tax=Microdochium trichocladiopsis TaxID=1682393 RepID=A0A9P8YI02_9PEZI|nr:uncharacterized protein B0I36DRAFT_311664 [Microdochium trichocladiopsis]KAH7040866.1 hypothetical protein B0I36DRAFT_311664 [Microdochium trichocladiopsis]